MIIDLNPANIVGRTPVEIARDMWKTRWEMPVGLTRSVEYGWVVILYRKTETDFVFMFSGMSRTELSVVQDAIRENWDEPDTPDAP